MFLRNTKMASFYAKRIILPQSSFLKIPRRNGYMILVPEIGEDLPGKYPLLKEDKSPEFINITIEKCIAAIGKQTLEFEEAVKSLGKQIEDVNHVPAKDLFNDILNPLEEMHTSVNITWGIAKTLYLGNQSLMPTKYYLSINQRASRAIASKYISRPIYQACKNILKSDEANNLSDEQRRVLAKFVLEGTLNGLELMGKKKLQFEEVAYLLLNKTKEYSQKLEAAKNYYTFTIRDPAVVRDFPEELLKSMAPDATQYHLGPWTATLHADIMEPFMEHCPDRVLRWKVWQANVIKASVLQDRFVQTSTTLEEIRHRRMQKANLLGYKSYADLSMETKMAASVEHVYNVLDNLLAGARPAQEYEIKELQAFANDRGLDGALQHWDIAYWGRKQLRAEYNYREEDINNYFPLTKVLCGLFELIEMLFDVKIVEGKKPDVWHKDVRFFNIFDLKHSSTDPISTFYLDPYARGNEKVRISQNAGYMITIQNKSELSGIKPSAALIFNFQPPVGETPSLLSFKDLQTLLRQFGHMLQHTLTRVEYADIAGFSFVEWDATLIQNYFLENWLYETSFLHQISSHRSTGEPLPSNMIDSLKDAKIHLAGYRLCNKLYLSQFDLELHSNKLFWNNIMGRIWSKYFVLPPYKKDSHICSFEPIFSGDWAAAYYSDVWSEMIAADLYSAFKDVSFKNKDLLRELGNRYRETFLSVGGTYSTNELFRKFRGRDPNPKALLKNLGLDTKCNMLQTRTEKIKEN